MLQSNQIYLGDCLSVMQEIDDKSVDLILCDLPYGTIKGKHILWDTIIPFDKLWEQYERIIKDNCAIVLFGREPFTSLIISSNINLYKHKWIWNKKQSGSYHLSKFMPLQIDEDIIVMGRGTVGYFPQMRTGKMRFKGGAKKNAICGATLEQNVRYQSDQYYPTNIIDLYNPKTKRFHPTQKPTNLLEYLIKTYSKENDLIVDNCFGSGSTLVAAKNLNRQFIGIEKEEKYFNIAKERLNLC